MRHGSVPAFLLCVAFLGVACDERGQSAPDSDGAAGQLMTPQDLQALERRPPDHLLQYGEEEGQHGELRLPPGPGPHPVVVLIHGGCFKAAYATTQDLAPMGDALKDEGIATWNVEYRRLGDSGGGWPGTYLDIGRAVDHLRTLATQYPLDLDRVIVVGHSAGGHLASWVAARGRLPGGSDLFVTDPLPIGGVIDMAGPIDMTANIREYEAKCGDAVVTSLLGGTPEDVPDRYTEASAINAVPLGIPQVLIWGEREDFVPLPLAEQHARQATAAGDRVRLIVIPEVGHFELASPGAASWPTTLAAIRALLDGDWSSIPSAGGAV